MSSIGATLEFSRTMHQAAALFIRSSAVRHDAILSGWYKRFFLKHFRAWHTFMVECGFDVHVHDIIFVTGHDLTADWATAVHYEHQALSGARARAGSVSFPASASAGFRTSFTRTITLPLRSGPNRDSRVCAEDDDDEPEKNQCIFIRGYRVVERMKMIPRVIKAAAGVDDLEKERDRDASVRVLSVEYDSDESAEPEHGDEVSVSNDPFL